MAVYTHQRRRRAALRALRGTHPPPAGARGRVPPPGAVPEARAQRNKDCVYRRGGAGRRAAQAHKPPPLPLLHVGRSRRGSARRQRSLCVGPCLHSPTAPTRTVCVLDAQPIEAWAMWSAHRHTVEDSLRGGGVGEATPVRGVDRESRTVPLVRGCGAGGAELPAPKPIHRCCGSSTEGHSPFMDAGSSAPRSGPASAMARILSRSLSRPGGPCQT